jgi:hypothetical protein
MLMLIELSFEHILDPALRSWDIRRWELNVFVRAIKAIDVALLVRGGVLGWLGVAANVAVGG